MRILRQGRQTGKTFSLVENLIEDKNSWLLVHSEAEKQRIIQQYFPGPLASKQIIDRIVTPSTVHSGRLRGIGRNSVLNIDNLDLVLPQLLGMHQIGIITTTEG